MTRRISLALLAFACASAGVSVQPPRSICVRTEAARSYRNSHSGQTLDLMRSLAQQTQPQRRKRSLSPKSCAEGRRDHGR